MKKHGHGGAGDDRHGARQPHRFDPHRAALLDDPARFELVPTAEVLRMLAAAAGQRVIDFGAGTGAYAIELARARPDLEIVALDEQSAMLDLLRAKPAARQAPNLRVVHTSAGAELKGTADRLLALNVLHEVGDEALEALAELLKPEAIAVVIDWNADVERPVGPPRDHVYTPAEARARLRRAGLRVASEELFKYHYGLIARRA